MRNRIIVFALLLFLVGSSDNPDYIPNYSQEMTDNEIREYDTCNNTVRYNIIKEYFF